MDSDEEDPVRLSKTKSDSTIKHPFFMAPAERAARHLNEQISASNALNRAIRDNLDLVSDEEKKHRSSLSFPSSSEPNGFFQKRTKVAPKIGFQSVKLKRISSSDPPPFPKEFQIIYEPRDHFECMLPVFLKSSDLQLKLIEIKEEEDEDVKKDSLPSLAKIMKETFSDINFTNLQNINTTLNTSSLDIASSSDKNIFSSMYSDIDVALNSNQPVLWVLIGPSGVGKTHLVESLTRSLNLRLITIDSTQSPRNAKTFETLQTTLTHSSTPRSFFSSNSNQQHVSILFDEVEIAFESDKGYWTGLSQFLQSPASQSVPIFITSNASIAFLESIIKFPEYVQFFSNFPRGDRRKVSINSDFIGRLHRIDTSIEYEHLALSTGYHDDQVNYYFSTIPNSIFDKESFDSSTTLIYEALRWDGLIRNVHLNKNFDAFAYAEAASCADLLLAVSDSFAFVKINLDPVDNLQSEFFADDAIVESSYSLHSNTLLFSSLPEAQMEIYQLETFFIARELVERTIFSFTASLLNKTTQQNQKVSIKDWKVLSQKVAKRFFQYTRSLRSAQTWSSELLRHIILIEKDNNLIGSSSSNLFPRNRGRRKRAYYRIDEELLNQVLKFDHEYE